MKWLGYGCSMNQKCATFARARLTLSRRTGPSSLTPHTAGFPCILRDICKRVSTVFTGSRPLWAFLALDGSLRFEVIAVR